MEGSAPRSLSDSSRSGAIASAYVKLRPELYRRQGDAIKIPSNRIGFGHPEHGA